MPSGRVFVGKILMEVIWEENTMTMFLTKVKTMTLTMLVDGTTLSTEVKMRSVESILKADNIADRLVKKLNAPECRPFFCKCAYILSENDIEILLENATKPSIKAPKNYFTRTAKILLAKFHA